MKTQNIVIVIIVLILLGGAAWFATSEYGSNLFSSDSAKVTYKNADERLIVVDNVSPGVTVLPQFKVFGKARGTWYFEASFPVDVVAANGRKIAQGHAEAQGEWMTEEFVPFMADVQLTESYSGPATLVLHKDNPSGEASRDASLEMPIVILAVE